MEDIFTFLGSLSPAVFVRLFWFFIFFECMRFFFLKLATLLLWRMGKRKREQKKSQARKKFLLENPLVSVVIPGKNEGKHIYKLVASLKEQTYKNIEIIIVDDGSDDETNVICQSLYRHGLIDKFLHNEVRGGKASAANLGFRYSKGKFSVHLDGDCSYSIDAIEKIIIPFYEDERVGGVGGNILVRNHDESVCTTLQAIEYTCGISIGRIITSYWGIYRIISGAFGAFRTDVLEQIGGWDMGPGLDGDITVKIRKLGYKTAFEPDALCLTNVPNTFKKLTKQRLRWDKSLVRFRLRKHRDVFHPNAAFRFSNFISFADNIVFNVILNIKWCVYFMDMFVNCFSLLRFIVPVNLLLYIVMYYVKFLTFSLFMRRNSAPVYYFLPYLPLMVIYSGFFLRIVRSIAHCKEFFFKASYNDPWNPSKTSRHAKAMGL